MQAMRLGVSRWHTNDQIDSPLLGIKRVWKRIVPEFPEDWCQNFRNPHEVSSPGIDSADQIV